MNKVEFAVCRIRQILPKNEGSLTRGSGCVVKCEWFSSARGWKCPYLLVTSSNVLHRDEIASGKAFVADFLLKDKKGLETFDLKLAADTCVDVPGRTDISAKEQSMTIISVEKLDKRGFLRRMAKKSSLQTTRPLDCFDTAKLNDELKEGLYCHVIREADQDFSTRTYKFLFLAETRHFVLQDFGNTEINSIRGFPNDEMPLGAVIYTKRGEFAGLLEFSEERIEPYFFPVEIRLSAKGNGEQADQPLSNNNASAAQAGVDQADIPDEDGDKEGLEEASNEEGKDVKQTEEGYIKADAVESHGDNNAADHEVPLNTSTGTTSAEAAHSTVGQSDISISTLQRDDGTVPSLPVSVCQSSVVAENHDKVVVEVHTKGEDLAGSSSERNSCNGVDESPKHEEQNAEVDKTGLDEIVTSVGVAEDNLKNEEDTACELLENTSENQTFVREGTSVSEDSTLITAASTQEELDHSKAEEQSRVAEEFLDSTTGSEEHTSSVQRTVSDELQSSQAAEYDTGKQTENESATTLIQSSAESATELSRDFELAKAAHDNLSDEEPVCVNTGAEQGEEVTNLPGADTVTDELVDDKTNDISQREQSTPSAICIPETPIETPSDTHSLDKDTVEDILSTASAVVNVDEEKEEDERSPENSREEPSEKFAHVESEEQELNVEEEADTGKEETEKEREEDHEKVQEEKEGDREAKSAGATEEKEGLEQTELGPAAVQDNEGRESEQDESTPEQDQEEEKVNTTKTGEDGETAVTDKEEKESEEDASTPEQDQEVKVTTAIDEGEDGEAAVTDKDEKESEEEESTPEQDQEVKVTTAIDEGEDGEAAAVTDTEETGVKGEEMDKRESEESKEEQLEDQAQGKDEEEERAEGSEEKKNGEDAEISTVPEEQTGGEENEREKIIEAQEEEDEGEENQEVQVQNRAENVKEDEDVKVRVQGEEDEDEGEVEKVHNQQEDEDVKVHNQEEKDEDKGEVEKVHINDAEKDEEEKEDMKVHNQVEKDENEEEEAKVYIRGEKDDGIEVDGNEDHDPRERRKQVQLMKQEEEENEEEEEEEADNVSDIIAQRIDADSLLSETITNNSRILDELARCLDTDYQYSLLPSWRDLADLLAIPAEAYEHYDVYSVSSPTEDLFVFLSTTKPDLTMKDIKEALVEIGRPDVVQIMDKFRMRNLISNESVVGSLVEREDRDLLGKLALKLDRGSTITWKHLAEQLAIPRRVYRNFGCNQAYNSALLLLKYLPIFDPELTIEDLKEALENILRDDVIAVLGSAGIPDDEHVRDILDDVELMDQITDLLNEEAPSPNWRQLAKELKVPQEKCQLFEPTADERSCTKLLFRSLEKSEPDITVEELILALVAMKRQDVLDVLAKYLDGDDIDLILEENNLLLDESHNSLSEGDTAN